MGDGHIFAHRLLHYVIVQYEKQDRKGIAVAKRYVYHSIDLKPFYEAIETEFKWNSGLNVAQKQKNIAALHEACKQENPAYKLLEISGKSMQELGKKLSLS